MLLQKIKNRILQKFNTAKRSQAIKKLKTEPLSAELHLAYAKNEHLYGSPYLAFSELKTAQFLGVSMEASKALEADIRRKLPGNTLMNHNQFFRFETLRQALLSTAPSENISILDVGAGLGEFASFLPNSKYCLVEPDVNGISGTELPFEDNTFDYTVSCHVLEHIPVSQREQFLDQLLAKTKSEVILLNPFHAANRKENEQLELVLDITRASWASEHLECTLPTLEFIKEYADERGVDCEISPNGTMLTTLACVFIDHFRTFRTHRDWEKMNAFFNTQLSDEMLTSPELPTAYLVRLTKH